MNAELEIIRRAELVALGDSPQRATRLVRAGQLMRLRRGIYVNAEEWRLAEPAVRHRTSMRSLAAVPRVRPPVFSHESAAVVHGIPLIGALPPRPHVIVPPGSTKSSRLVRRTERRLPSGRIDTLEGFHLTDPAMTALDLAAVRSRLGGIIAVSHVRRVHRIDRSALAAELDAMRPCRFATRIEHAVAHSLSDSESPLETLVAVRCADLGFAAPEQQLELVVEGRRYRVDFAWGGGDVVLEADGRAKYGALAAAAGTDGASVVWAEKQREDAIRTRVRAFGRTDWAAAWDGTELERTLIRLGVPRVRPPRPLTR